VTDMGSESVNALSGSVDNAAGVAAGLHGLQQASQDAYTASQDQWALGLVNVEGGINASLAEERRNVAGMQAQTKAMEAEAAQIVPQINNALNAARDEYKRLVEEGHTEEEAQEKLLNNELWAQTQGLKAVKAKYKEEGKKRLIDLNRIAAVILSARQKSEDLSKYIKVQDIAFNHHLQEAAEYEVNHNEEDVANLKSKADSLEYSTSDFNRWLGGFRKVDSEWNKRIHSRLTQLGADMNHTVFNELAALYEEEKSLRGRTNHMTADFITHLANDEASVHEKMTALYMSADKAVEEIMARKGLSDQQKQALVDEIRALSAELGRDIAKGKDALGGEHMNLQQKLLAFKRLVDYADGKFGHSLEGVMSGKHHETVGSMMNLLKSISSLGTKYPWFKDAGADVTWHGNADASFAETGGTSSEDSSETTGLSEADAELAKRDAALELRVEQLERAFRGS